MKTYHSITFKWNYAFKWTQVHACVHTHTQTWAFYMNINKLYYELWLVTNLLLFQNLRALNLFFEQDSSKWYLVSRDAPKIKMCSSKKAHPNDITTQGWSKENGGDRQTFQPPSCWWPSLTSFLQRTSLFSRYLEHVFGIRINKELMIYAFLSRTWPVFVYLVIANHVGRQH